ncbi:hypothetical protein D3C86_1842040 [compost metagenome]
MHEMGNTGLPGGQRRLDRRARCQPSEQADPDEGKNTQAEQTVQPEKQAPQVTAARQQPLDFDTAVYADKQRQHQPVHRDRQFPITLCCYIAGHCGPHERHCWLPTHSSSLDAAFTESTGATLPAES